MKNTFADYGLAGDPGTDAFWASASGPASVPAADGGWATLFLWRGGPATLAFENWADPVPLSRWGDTDCWYAEVPMPARLRVTYWFVGDDGAVFADPANAAGTGGERSIATTPDLPAQPHWPDVAADDVLPLPRARVRWTSARLGGRRTVRVHPVGGGGPVVLLLDGDDWLYLHPAMTAFDAAFDAGDLPPATLVFLPAAQDRRAEFECRPDLWEAVRDELLPLLAEGDVPADTDRVIAAGQSLGGLSALYAALEFPGLLSGAACQSGSFWWTPDSRGSANPLAGPAGGAIAARLRTRPDLSALRLAFDVGEHEHGMLPHCTEVEALTRQTGATVRVSRSPSAHDRAGWRHALLRDTAWLLT
ncbi:enterochelin esterase family protein [Actinocorallia herbida]|uniref:Enterochelin esterase family protein n=1 Tax=Actinocorallia herbida TaxID=58109 RepID=A0A3N1CYD4_9ACTN|nr:alpha/beta hydrolase-fold protein [Actinocorallia herbida]ROO86284.1 enterochelin esterase family protein [Actinocorallia herbida]